ncbi:hypothetical protein ACJZ2D_005715 [Fusarium nematophilum]
MMEESNSHWGNKPAGDGSLKGSTARHNLSVVAVKEMHSPEGVAQETQGRKRARGPDVGGANHSVTMRQVLRADPAPAMAGALQALKRAALTALQQRGFLATQIAVAMAAAQPAAALGKQLAG